MKTYKHTFNNKEIEICINYLAKNADASVLVKSGKTSILTTVTYSSKASNANFFPLTVEYIEKQYAAGKIPGGYNKREGKPSENAILMSRLIDRPIRPLFDKLTRNEVNLVNTVLSVDLDDNQDFMALLGSSIALMISSTPYNTPIVGISICINDGELIINPTKEQKENSQAELFMCVNGQEINMIETVGEQIEEEVVLQACQLAIDSAQELIKFQLEIAKECGKEKIKFIKAEYDQEIYQEVQNLFHDQVKQALGIKERTERDKALDETFDKICEHFDDEDLEFTLAEAFDGMLKNHVRDVINNGNRVDGREFTQVRDISCDIDMLPKVHGVGLFNRGQTQTLSTTTLGSLSENQRLDGIDGETEKRFMLHYNFPPYSMGKTGRIGFTSRREIGHGALGEKAILPLLPSTDEFPYAIRVVSEVMESNGSTSQASICSGILSLLDAGVPIKNIAAGVAMGLVNDSNTVLTDIQDIEDFYGDMDFKVAGTTKGITAIQLDTKISGLSIELIKETLLRAKEARLGIIDTMEKVIDTPRPEVKEDAPKIKVIKVNPDKIGDVIGPGGKVINKIIEEYNVAIDFEDDGKTFIMGTNLENIQDTIKLIETLTLTLEVGMKLNGVVERVEEYGAFVKLENKQKALLHISKLSDKKVEKVEDVINVNDHVNIEVIEISNKGIKGKLIGVINE